MTDTWIATSTIKHGKGEDEKVFYPGDRVNGLDKEVMERLVEIGSVKKQEDLRDATRDAESSENAQTISELRAQNAELQARVAELTAKLTSGVTPPEQSGAPAETSSQKQPPGLDGGGSGTGKSGTQTGTKK